MKPAAVILLVFSLLCGGAEAAGERWANRLNAAEGETLLWLEADLAPPEAPKEAAKGEAAEGEMKPVEGGDAATETAPPTQPPAPTEAQVTDAAAPPAAATAPADETAEQAGMEPPPEPPKDRFAALVLPFLTPQPQGGVILLHDRGGHPDWPGVIAPLRRGLPDHGWATLSIEFPSIIGDPKRRIRQAVKRIEAALKFYNQRQLYNVVLVGHGEGALAAVAYLADNMRAGITGFVSVGLEAPPESIGGLLLLEGIYMPMLELYGERDIREVVVGAREREQAVLRGGNANYRQQRIAGADHFFTATEPRLVELVRRWLKRYASGMEIKLGSREGRAIRKSLGLMELGGGDGGGDAAGKSGDVELDDAP